MAEDEQIPTIPTKSTLRINLKCPRERELLEKYYNLRRVLDTSVSRDVIEAFKIKEGKQLAKNQKQNERYKNIVENEPERLEKMREQGRIAKKAFREREKQKKLEENFGEETESVVSSTLFTTESIASAEPTKTRKRVPVTAPPPPLDDRDADFSDDTIEEPTPPPVKARPKPNFYFGGGMRF